MGIVLSVVMAACAPMGVLPEHEERADALMQAIVRGEADVIALMSTPAIQYNDVVSVLPQMQEMVPQGDLPEGQTTSWNNVVSTGGNMRSVVRTYEYPDRYVYLSVNFLMHQGEWRVDGFNVSGQPKPVHGNESGGAGSGAPIDI